MAPFKSLGTVFYSHSIVTMALCCMSEMKRDTSRKSRFFIPPCIRRPCPLCAWHSTGVPVWQPAAYIRDRRSSMSPLCWHHNTTSAVDSSSYPRRPRLSGGCSACMEQSATRDSGLLLTFNIPEGDQVSPFSSVIRLTCAVYSDGQQTSALSCATVSNLEFAKCPRNYVMAAL